LKIFDLIFIISGWGLGNLIFNKFEKHLPWWRRIGKLLMIMGILYLVGLAGRAWIYAVLGMMMTGMTVLHAYWFPKHGINGLTAEPYNLYLNLINKVKKTPDLNKPRKPTP
jgi:hypothetical protein